MINHSVYDQAMLIAKLTGREKFAISWNVVVSGRGAILVLENSLVLASEHDATIDVQESDKVLSFHHGTIKPETDSKHFLLTLTCYF